MNEPKKSPCVVCGEPAVIRPGEKPIHAECKPIEAKQGRLF
jgi:predicted nucleic acid-binding Zn ribbon protein